jgi:lipopolysaccharide cholinephosphotransferase
MKKFIIVIVILSCLLLICFLFNLIIILTANENLSSMHHKLYNLYGCFQQFCSAANCEFVACGGTLLGSVRHGGIIPWDDDIDVMMTKSNIDNLKKNLKNSQWTIVDMDKNIGKFQKFIHVSDTNKILKHGFSVPFIDIFPSEVIQDQFTFSDEKTRKLWPKHYIQTNEMYPLKMGSFGLFDVPLPREAEKYCERAWGDKWRKGVPLFRTPWLYKIDENIDFGVYEKVVPEETVETVDVYFTDASLNVPYGPTRNCDVKAGSMTKTLPPWQANLLQNPNGNVTKKSDVTFSFQPCIPQPNNPQLCTGDWYMKEPNVLCPFTRPVCPNNSTYVEDVTQKTKGHCECKTYTSSADGKTKQYFGDTCQYGDNTTCNGGGIANLDGSCTCNPDYIDSTCNCTLDFSKLKTFVMNGMLGSFELKDVKITLTSQDWDPHLPYWTTDYNDDTWINITYLGISSKDKSVHMVYKTDIFPCRNVTWIPTDPSFKNLYFTAV